MRKLVFIARQLMNDLAPFACIGVESCLRRVVRF
jgi:hypothetical protein